MLVLFVFTNPIPKPDFFFGHPIPNSTCFGSSSFSTWSWGGRAHLCVLQMYSELCSNSKIGSVVVKCKKNYIWKCKIFFCLKLPNSSRKSIKKFLHFKMSYTGTHLFKRGTGKVWEPLFSPTFQLFYIYQS